MARVDRGSVPQRVIVRRALGGLLVAMTGLVALPAMATPGTWESASNDYNVTSGECSGCHTYSSSPSMVLQAPSSLAHDADVAALTISGMSSSAGYSSLRVRLSGGSAGNPGTEFFNSVGNGNLNINLSTLKGPYSRALDPVTLQYCLVKAVGSTRNLNCSTVAVDRLAPPDNPPTITSANPGNQTLSMPSGTFEFPVTASDDNGTPSLTVTSSASGIASVSAIGGGQYRVSAVAPGTATITIKATDSIGQTDTRSFKVTVQAAPTDNPPTITSANPGNQTLVLPSGTFDFAASASDDNSTPSLSVTSSNAGIASVSETGSGQYRVSTVSAGSATITVTATDSIGQSATQSFTVTVQAAVPGNTPPLITSDIPVGPTLQVGATFDFTVVAVDAESGVTFSAMSSAPAVATIETVSTLGLPNTVSLRVTALSAGTSKVTVTVSDSANATASLSFPVTVEDLVLAVEPSINAVSPACDITLATGEAVTLSVDASGGSALTYTYSSSAPGILAVAGDGAKATLTALAGGSASVTVTVTDTRGASDSRTVNVRVNTPNGRPFAKGDTRVIALSGGTTLIDVLGNDSDPEGDTLSIVLDADRSSRGAALAVQGTQVAYTPDGPLTEEDSFSYRVRDPAGATSDSAVVTLKPSDEDGDGVADVIDNCPVFANSDQGDMDSDGAGDACDADPDGDGAPGISGDTFASGKALVEEECLLCHLTGASGAPVFGDEGAWDARIAAAGGNAAGLLPSVSNGLGAMPAFGASYTAKQLLEAIFYLSGEEDTGPIIDLDLDEVADDRDNCPTVPNADQADADGNGTGDACEPLADGDGDGYPFRLDDDDSNARRLLANVPTTNTTVFTALRPLALGPVASERARETGYASAGIVMPPAEFARVGAAVYPGLAIDVESTFNSMMGVIDLEIEPGVGKGIVTLQLASGLPIGADLHVFDSTQGSWQSFSDPEGGSMMSAPGGSSNCPAADSANYQPGLTAGDRCILITIQDGGVNDADRSTDLRVRFVGNIGRLPANDPGVGGGAGSGGGGGGSAYGLVLMAWLASVLRLAGGRRRERSGSRTSKR